MIKYISFISTICVVLSIFMVQSCQGERPAVSVSISGVPGDSCVWYVEAFPLSPLGESQWRDTVFMVNGKFSVDFRSDTLYKMLLIPELFSSFDNSEVDDFNTHEIIELYVDNDKPLKVNAVLEGDYISYGVEGSDLMRQYAEHVSQYRKEYAPKLIELNTEINSLTDADSLRREELFSTIFRIQEENRMNKIGYAKEHLSDDLAAIYLAEFAEDSLLAAEEGNLSPEVRNGLVKSLIDTRLKAMQYELAIRDHQNNVKLGCVAPDFDYVSLDGKEVSLSRLDGQKYVVLDFWGTWCAWCMRGIPRIKEYNNKYRDKAIFIGVNCNDKEDLCRKAVERLEMDWIQVIDKEGSDSSLVFNYAVQAFPTKIIIAPDRTIVGYFEGETDEFYHKLDELLDI